MAKGFFKDNEKVLMTLLLLFIAPTFALTGLTTWWLGYAGGDAAYEIFGESVSYAQVLEKRTELANTLWLQGVLQYGWYGARQPRRASDEDVLQAFMFEHELEELDLELSDGEYQEALRQAALSMIAWHQVLENTGGFGAFQDNFTLYNSIRPSVTFNGDRYLRAIQDPDMGLGLSIQEFEAGVIKANRTAKLIESVTSAAIVTEKEIYDEFLLGQQKRVFEIVSIGDQQFSAEALEQLDQDYFRQVYDNSPEDYKSPTRIQLEVARVVLANLRDDDYQPATEEIEAYYEANKDPGWRIKRPVNYVPPENAQPEDDFRPFTDVFEGIISRIRQERAKAREGEILEAALAEGQAKSAAGGNFEMPDLFGDAKEFVEVHTTEPFGNTEYSRIEPWMRNAAHLSPLFVDLRLDPELFKPGTMSKAIVPGTQGSYIYRLVEVFPESTMTFEEALDKVMEKAEKEKAKELASKFISDWITSATEEEPVSLESFASEQNLTVHTSDAVGRNEAWRLRLDTRAPLANLEILSEGFALLEEGQVGGPVTNDRDTNVYALSLKTIESPEIILFNIYRNSIDAQIRRNKQQAILEQYRADLSRKADVRVYTSRSSDPSPLPEFGATSQPAS